MSKTERLLDNDGYPTEVALKTISEWNVYSIEEYHELMEFTQPLLENYGNMIRDGETYTLITGGWSGNESIVEALHKNVLFHFMYWFSSQRGGRHVYKPHNKGII